MVKESSYLKIFNFLKEKEQLQDYFTLTEIAESCNIKEGTVLKYFSEKISNFIIKDNLSGEVLLPKGRGF